MSAHRVPPSTSAPLAPQILLVTAHPDDEALFGGTAYAATRWLGGAVDLAVVTNGEGGYRYSAFAEPLYGLKLTEEAVARAHLPRIRKQELMAAGRILGLRNYFFLDQPDGGYALGGQPSPGAAWDTGFVTGRLRERMAQGGYDFVFVMLPLPTTHTHHRASALLALEAAASLPSESRPLVLGASLHTRGEVSAVGREGFPIPALEGFSFSGVEGHPLAAIKPGAPVFELDRTRKLDARGVLDYRIVINWLIAEHKTQGMMQLRMNDGEVERYWYFDLNPESGIAKTRALFERLGQVTA